MPIRASGRPFNHLRQRGSDIHLHDDNSTGHFYFREQHFREFSIHSLIFNPVFFSEYGTGVSIEHRGYKPSAEYPLSYPLFSLSVSETLFRVYFGLSGGTFMVSFSIYCFFIGIAAAMSNPHSSASFHQWFKGLSNTARLGKQ